MCSNHKTSVKKSQNLSIKVLTFRSIILSIINTNICHYCELVKKFSKFGRLLILLNVGKLIPKHRKTHYYGLVPSKILFTVYIPIFSSHTYLEKKSVFKSNANIFFHHYLLEKLTAIYNFRGFTLWGNKAANQARACD